MTCSSSCRRALPGGCDCACRGEHHGEAAPIRQLSFDSARDAVATSGGVPPRVSDPVVEGAAATTDSSADGVGSESAGGVDGHTESSGTPKSVGPLPVVKTAIDLGSRSPGLAEVPRKPAVESGPALSLPAGVPEHMPDARAVIGPWLGFARTLLPFVAPPGVRVRPGIRHDDSPCWVARYNGALAIGNTPEDAARRVMR